MGSPLQHAFHQSASLGFLFDPQTLKKKKKNPNKLANRKALNPEGISFTLLLPLFAFCDADSQVFH
jgi:hypothetical protein